MAADSDTTPLHDLVMAAHSDLAEVEARLRDHPELLDVPHPDTGETPLGAAAHMGRRDIATFLLEAGAEPTLCAVAMLGDLAAAEELLQRDPSLIDIPGAHGIPLMFHAAISGSVAVAERLQAAGCTTGYNAGLQAAAARGHEAMSGWLLAHGVDDVNAPGFQGRTALDQALANGHDAVAALLRSHGARTAEDLA